MIRAPFHPHLHHRNPFLIFALLALVTTSQGSSSNNNGEEQEDAAVFRDDGGLHIRAAAQEDVFIHTPEGAEVALKGGRVFINGLDVIAKFSDTDKLLADANRQLAALSGEVEVLRELHPLSPTEVAKLTANDTLGKRLGFSVAVSGNVVLVGPTPTVARSPGAVYVFERGLSGAWTQTARLNASDAEQGDSFGWAVGVSGRFAIVGAHGNDKAGENAGAVYFFEQDRATGAWNQQARVTASDAVAGDRIGWSVAISGSYAVVGASNSGAYIFERDGSSGVWTEKAKLIASDAAVDDRFGRSVAISGNYAVIGAPEDDHDDFGTSNTGSAYVFERDSGSGTWTEAAKLVASDPVELDVFGWSVAVSGDYLVVGAYGRDDNGPDSGAAYVFERDSSPEGTTAPLWTQTAKLVAADAATLDFFGYCVAMAGNHVVVGAQGKDDNGQESGSAYVFARETDGSGGASWVQGAKLTASDALASAQFGIAVAVSGSTVVIGSSGLNDIDGSTYVFTLT